MGQAQWEYSLRHAAQLAGVSVDTIKRRLRAGDLPHARQRDDPARTWVAPLGDLVAAGFCITPSRSLQAPAPSAGPRPGEPDASPLQIRLAVAEAVQKVHAEYAQAFAELAAQAVKALGNRGVTQPAGESTDQPRRTEPPDDPPMAE
jgi:hypothetical protein